MILVINEWIFHDLLGENGPVRFRETAEFVVKLSRSNDTVVMPNEDRWRRKARELRESAIPLHREAGRLFVDLFWDSTRSILLLSEHIPPVPQSAYDWAPSEDVYLVEACVAANADLLVTTDETLFDSVRENGAVECQMRDNFLSGYNPTGSNN